MQYLIVGGLAVNHYGYNRSTGDVDFWIKDTKENRHNIIHAFEKLGYGKFDELLDTPFIPGFCEIYLDSGIYADLLSEIHGFSQKDFDQCKNRGKKVQVNDVAFTYLSLEDLIKSKETSSRPKDSADVLQLKKIYEL